MINETKIANEICNSNITGIVIKGDLAPNNIEVIYSAKNPSNTLDKDLFITKYLEAIEQQKYIVYLKKIDNKINDLITGAISMILEINGTPEYVRNQKELYFHLYNQAKDVTGVHDKFLTLNMNIYNAQNNVSLNLADYKNLVIQKWEGCELVLNQFISMIEVVRKLWKGYVLGDNITKADQVKTLVESITSTSTPQQVSTVFNNITQL